LLGRESVGVDMLKDIPPELLKLEDYLKDL
jgi:hypothetical protein